MCTTQVEHVTSVSNKTKKKFTYRADNKTVVQIQDEINTVHGGNWPEYLYTQTVIQ